MSLPGGDGRHCRKGPRPPTVAASGEEDPSMTVHAAELAHLQGVHKRYGPVLALGGIDLSLRAGQVHALLGANGAGKTTAIALLLGLAPRMRATWRCSASRHGGWRHAAASA